MGPTSSFEAPSGGAAGDDPCALSDAHQETLLQLARRAVEHAAMARRRLAVDPLAYPAVLQRPRACFVTLYGRGGDLRGCVGSLRAVGSLVEEVARAAYAAAVRDPRFRPVADGEVDGLTMSVSVLSTGEALSFASEDDLLAQLRPGRDGVVLRDGARSATFLPVVWDRYPRPTEFLTQLKLKAGLPPDHWSDALEVDRYTTVTFTEQGPRR